MIINKEMIIQAIFKAYKENSGCYDMSLEEFRQKTFDECASDSQDLAELELGFEESLDEDPFTCTYQDEIERCFQYAWVHGQSVDDLAGKIFQLT